MGILGFGGRRVQQRATIEPQHKYEHSHCDSTRRDRGKRNKQQHLSRFNRFKLHTDNTRWSIPIFTTLPWARRHESDGNPESNRGYKRNRHNKYLYPVVLCLSQLAIVPATLAENVGGVSATANPIANSSGSVTNQAIQVLQGPYITNTYGNGISCQGPTLNVTPFITHGRSYQEPWDDIYYEPQYDSTDFIGRTIQVQKNVKNYPWEPWYDDRTKDDGTRWFEDGADMTVMVDEIVGDGIPDNPGSVIWQKPVRTGQQDNLSTNIGLSATLSWPLDNSLQDRCKKAADTHTELQAQLVANKRLDFEIARLKNCGELLQKGISFHPKSPYYSICADVVVQGVNTIRPHVHSIPSTEANGTAEDLGTFSIGNP